MPEAPVQGSDGCTLTRDDRELGGARDRVDGRRGQRGYGSLNAPGNTDGPSRGRRDRFDTSPARSSVLPTPASETIVHTTAIASAPISHIPVRVAPSPSFAKGKSESADRSTPRSLHAVSPDARCRLLGALTNVGVTLFRGFVPGASAARLLALLVDAASNVPLKPFAQFTAPQFLTSIPLPSLAKPIAQP